MTNDRAPGTRLLTLTEKVEIAENVVQLDFEDPTGAELPAWTPGAHIDLLLGGDIVRQYSLCGSPADRCRWRIAVLRENAGRGGSRLVHDKLAPGDSVAVRGPRNNFALSTASSYLFIAGGIGITPILPMIHEAERRGSDWQLHYGGRTRSSMAFSAHLSDRYGKRVYIVPENEVGRMDLNTLLAKPRPDTLVYCCGPSGLLQSVLDQGPLWQPESIHTERFAAKALEQTGPDGDFDVETSISGHTVTVPAGSTVLEALSAVGVDVMYSCREGTCGTCETRVLSGIVDHRDSLLTPAEQAANDTMMVCVSRATSPKLVLEL